MKARTSVSVNTEKARKMACKDANLMRNIEASSEYQCGIRRYPSYIEKDLNSIHERAKRAKEAEIMALLKYCGMA